MPDTPNERKPTETGLKVLYALAAVVIVVAGLRAAGEFLLPVLLGMFLAVLSLPLLKWLVTRKVPRPLAIGLTVGADVLLISGLLFLAASAFPDQKQQLAFADKLKEKAQELSRSIDAQLLKFTERAEEWNNFSMLSDDEEVEGDPGQSAVAKETAKTSETEESVTPTPTADAASADMEKTIPVVAALGAEGEEGGEAANAQFTFSSLFKRYWDSKILLNWIGGMDVVGRLTSLITKSFFVLIIMIFVLSESHRYAEKVRGVIRRRGPDLRRFQNSSQDLQKYLAIKTVVSAGTGFLAWAACSALGVDFPVLWGLVAFLFNFVPAIGSIVAAIPPALFAWVEHDLLLAFAVIGCYLVINIGIGNFVEPMLLGDRFGISTVVVILSVLFWGFIWGPVGMFLAVPLTMVVKVMLDNSTDLRWLSVMMSKDGRVDRTPRGRRGGLRTRVEPDDDESLALPEESGPAEAESGEATAQAKPKEKERAGAGQV